MAVNKYIYISIGQWGIRWHTSDSRPARIGNVAKRLKFRCMILKKSELPDKSMARDLVEGLTSGLELFTFPPQKF